MNSIISPIDEKNYNEIMTNKVEPFLAKIRKDDSFISFDGKRIHYEAYVTKDAKANVVISHGFTESAEKFREMSYYFIENGFNAFAIDHRGHGDSYRIPGAPDTVRIDKFGDYVEDLNIFVSDVVKKSAPDLPMYLYAHSMGGAVGILYLQKYNDVFSKAVLSSPMVCANTGMPIPIAKALAGTFCSFGKGDSTVFGRGKFDPKESFENSNDTSEARFNYYLAKRIKNPQLRTCGPSFNWVKESMKITNIMLEQQNCDKINAEVIIFQPQTDKSVLSPYENKFASKLPGARLIQIPGSKHEIFYSTDDVLKGYLKEIMEFLG